MCVQPAAANGSVTVTLCEVVYSQHPSCDSRSADPAASVHYNLGGGRHGAAGGLPPRGPAGASPASTFTFHRGASRFSVAGEAAD